MAVRAFSCGAKNSPYLRPEDEEAIRRLFPNAQFYTIPRAGHWVHVDNSTAVKEVLQKFLERS